MTAATSSDLQTSAATRRWHLAQLNIGTLHEPMDHPRTADFADALDPVNALGEASPGFVWRLQDEAGNATSIQPFPNPLTIVNLTVWESVSALRDFAYRGTHRDFFRRRAEWFTADGSATALWWIPAGTEPTVDDARHRLDFIDRFGPSPYAFRMGQTMPQLGIARTDLADPDAQALITALNTELSARYPEPGSTFFTLDPAQVAPGAGGFFVSTLDDVPVGCGAYRLLDPAEHTPQTAEIKRMYVAPGGRGSKLGAAMLATLERAAVADGARRLVLETGVRQPEALGLYERTGFARIPCWGAYAHAPTSVCLGKAVGDGADD